MHSRLHRTSHKAGSGDVREDIGDDVIERHRINMKDTD
jgi:hypothetical protein